MPVATDLEFAEVQVLPALAVQLPGQCAPDPPSIAPPCVRRLTPWEVS